MIIHQPAPATQVQTSMQHEIHDDKFTFDLMSVGKWIRAPLGLIRFLLFIDFSSSALLFWYGVINGQDGFLGAYFAFLYNQMKLRLRACRTT